MSVSKTSTPFLPSLSHSSVNLLALREHARKELIDILDSHEGKKALVLDPQLAGVVGLIAEASVLKEHGVSGFYSLATPIPMPAEFKVIIYLVRPRMEHMQLVSEHVNFIRGESKTSREYCLYFVPRRSILCEKALEEADVYNLFSTIAEYHMDLVPFDDDVISMENDQAFRDLYIDGDPSVLFHISKSIIKLQHLFGLIPNIKISLIVGDNAREVARMLFKMRSELETDFDHVSEIDTLIIIDRSTDLVTPMLTQHTYEGQLDEWVEIKNNAISVEPEVFGPVTDSNSKLVKLALNSGDILFKEIRDMNMETLGNFLSKKAAYLRENYEERHKAATVSELGEWVKKFKNHLQIEHSLLQVHIALAEKLTISRRLVANDRKFKAELAMLAGNLIDESVDLNVEHYLETCIAKRDSIHRVLRLLILLSLTNGGLRGKRFDFWRNEILQTYGYEYLFTLNNIEQLGAIRKSEEISLGFGFMGSATENKHAFSGLRKLVCTHDAEDELAKPYLGYCPLSVKIVEAAASKNGWRGSEELLSLIHGAQQECKQNSTPENDEKNFLGNQALSPVTSSSKKAVDQSKSDSKIPVTLVFYVGGVTFGEISAIRALGKRDKSRDYIVATTKLINGTSLIEGCIEKIENSYVPSLNKNSVPVRVRYAPSPTGDLHLGGLRTALYNYLFSRHLHGRFILRVEDTDQTRLVPGSVDRLVQSLQWAGIPFDEGPGKEGDCGPYVQSQRIHIYKKYAEKLVKEKKAYPCFCTEERLELMKKLQAKHGGVSSYDKHCLGLSEEEIKQKLEDKIPHVIRMKVEDGKTAFEDMIRGRIEFDHEDINDQVLMKSDGFPTYHLANVVDDHLMKISHVIRGEEWITSTPKHICLYKSLGWEPPKFAHLPLLLNRNRKKLSKRDGASTVEAFQKLGFLPEALINFVALLGWSSGTAQEIFTLEELGKLFELTKVQKGGAIVDMDRLKWINHKFLRQRIQNDKVGFLQLVKPLIASAFPNATVTDDFLLRIITMCEDRLHVLPEILEYGSIYLQGVDFSSEKVIAARSKAIGENSIKILEKVLALTTEISESDFTAEYFKTFLKELPKTLESTSKEVLSPLRFVLSGQSSGTPLEEILSVLGKTVVVMRINNGITYLKNDGRL